MDALELTCTWYARNKDWYAPLVAAAS